MSNQEHILKETNDRLRIELDACKRADASIQRLSHQNFLILSSSGEGILGLDLQGRHTFVNPAAAELLGYSSQELLGHPSHLLWHHSRADGTPFPLSDCPILKAYEDGEIHYANGDVFWRKDGSSFPVDYVSTPIMENGQLMGAVVSFRDASERLRNEAAIRESREQLQDLLDNASDLIQSVTPDGRFIYVNRAWHEALGYTEEDLLNINLSNVIAPDHASICQAWFGKLLRGESIPKVETVFIAKDGRRIDVEGSVNCRFENGHPVVTRSIFRDVTKRRLDEVALLKSEERYRLLFEHNPLPMWVYDTESLRFLAVNQAAIEHYGYERDEFLALTIRDIRPPEELPRLELNLLEPRQSRELSGPWKHRLKDGSIIEVEIISHDTVFLSGSARLVLAKDITDRRRAEKKIERQLEQLTALREIDHAINSGFDLHANLAKLLAQVIKQLGVDAADVLVINPHSQLLEYCNGLGFHTEAIKHSPIRLEVGSIGRADFGCHLVHIPNLVMSHNSPRLETALVGDGFVSYHCTPLIAKGEMKGVLEVFKRTPLEPDEDWLDFFNILAGQAAIAIDIALLFDSLQHTNTQLIQSYDATIEGLSRVLDLRDKETEGHTQRVARMAVSLAREVGLGIEALRQIRRGALLHDIGKMGIPDHILLKPGKLTNEEWSVMQKHPTFAYEILSPIKHLQSALDIPYCHHEKWDGTGYPRGLKGEQIPLEARIFAVVDVWDALTSNRPYRQAWSKEKATGYIQSMAGSQFDTHVVEVFLNSEERVTQNEGA